MLWITGVVLLLVGLVLGFMFGHRVAVDNLKPSFFRLGQASASDRQLILSLLRRPIANFLIWRDPDRFLKLYREEYAFSNSVGDFTAEKRSAMLKELADEFPFYQDFDLLAVRDYVLTADQISSYSVEDLESHFRKLARYQSLMTTFDIHWTDDLPISANDLAYVDEYASRVKDTIFKRKLAAALDEYFAHRNGLEMFDRPKITVQVVPHFAESRYGIHLKETNEYGLYCSFSDYERDKTYQSFYRSDIGFNVESHLDDLRLNDHTI